MPKAGPPWQFLAVAVRVPILFAALVAGTSAPVLAQCATVGCGLCPTGTNCGIEQISGTATCVASSTQSCGCFGLPCNPPVNTGVTRTASQTNGVWKIRAEVAVTVPDNSKHTSLCTADANWFGSATPPGPLLPAAGLCHSGNWDKFRLFLEVGNLTCANLDNVTALKTYSLSVTACTGSSCQKRTDIPAIDLSPAAARQLLGCPVPPPVSGCPDDRGCSLCLGPGNGASPAGGGAGAAPDGSGPGARLRYSAGGAGSASLPAAGAWAATLGRGWSHDHAERIVLDPDAKHVWLITRFATFREFTDAAGDGTYETAAPSDEYRKLTKTATGWDLKELDGTIHRFDSAGLWTQTADRNGNTITGTYSSGRLSSVSFPDGRSETFAYQANGKLASITEVGVGGAASRTWSYTWTGDDLTRINRPDGTAWTFQYSDPNRPGYLTRMTLVGTDASERIEGAWEYDSAGNVLRTWKGAATATDPAAVEVYQFSFDNPSQPASTTVTDPLGKVSTYQIGRDTRSRKPRLSQLSGDCPACGLGPNSQLVYNDAANPLLPTEQIDGRGNRTVLTYNANGRLTSRTEAFGTPLARTTSWTYDSTFPDFPARIEQTSTFGGAALRATDFVYSPQGNLLTRTETGVEDGSAFSLSTDSTFNSAGQPLTVNPPGSGTDDQTAMTYDAGRGNLIPLTRVEPLIGTTSYVHDAFNRRTQVTDVNGLVTETQYDALNRPTQVRQVGATTAQDLITTYAYNAFGDLFRTALPQGNLIEYGYDNARRLISIERKPSASTPGERTFYTLDKFGHRTKEEKQRWNGTAWVTDSFTSFVYSSRCHLDKVVQADGSAIEYSYDCSGNLSQVWDANHPKTSPSTPSSQTYAYDALNRLTSVTQPWPAGGAAVTSYAYDVQDHLTQVTDAEGNVTSYVYSDRDLMTEETSAVSGLRTYAY
ncbi:MAG TPA: hypothetical protein VHU81_00475, partial [Thermoanaerobaculia bacterium]|nr:hypothetical protein [Thermoanaerobaculia bacterium]